MLQSKPLLESENIIQMVLHIVERKSMISVKVKEHLILLTNLDMTDNGSMTKWVEKGKQNRIYNKNFVLLKKEKKEEEVLK